MTTRSSQCDRKPSTWSPANVASAVNAPTVRTSPWENFMTSRTPKNSVKPTATRAYIMPSISPFMTYCANRPASMALRLYVSDVSEKAGRAAGLKKLWLHRQLAFAAGIFAVVPFHELAVLNHIFGDQRHSVLAVIVERDLADDRITILDIAERGDDFLAVRTDLFDGVEDHVHRRIGERAIGLRRVGIFLSVIFFHKELAARQLLDRRAFAEGERPLRQRSEPLNKRVGHDARGSVEHGFNAELVHLQTNPNPDRR